MQGTEKTFSEFFFSCEQVTWPQQQSKIMTQGLDPTTKQKGDSWSWPLQQNKTMTQGLDFCKSKLRPTVYGPLKQNQSVAHYIDPYRKQKIITQGLEPLSKTKQWPRVMTTTTIQKIERKMSIDQIIK